MWLGPLCVQHNFNRFLWDADVGGCKRVVLFTNLCETDIRSLKGSVHFFYNQNLKWFKEMFRYWVCVSRLSQQRWRLCIFWRHGKLLWKPFLGDLTQHSSLFLKSKINTWIKEKLRRGFGDVVLLAAALLRRDGSSLTGEGARPEEVMLLRADNGNKRPPGAPEPDSNCS